MVGNSFDGDSNPETIIRPASSAGCRDVRPRPRVAPLQRPRVGKLHASVLLLERLACRIGPEPDLLEQIDAKCEKVSVTELRDNTFFASITLSLNGSEMEIDSRPSDALALAVRCSAPIFAADDVIEESAIEFAEGEEIDEEQMVAEFKSFLDRVTPEEFAIEDEEEG